MPPKIQAIVMPKLGLSMTEGKITEWYVTEGSEVKPGDVIADIETSKITNELEVHMAGIIRGPLAKVDVDLPVGTLLGIIAEASVTKEEVKTFVSNFKPGNQEPLEAFPDFSSQETKPEKEETRNTRTESFQIQIPESLQGKTAFSDISATHLARKMAEKWSIDLSKIDGTGRRGRISKRDILEAVKKAGGNLSTSSKSTILEASESNENIRATPLARKIAKNEGIDLRNIKPSGSRGRINKADIEAFLSKKGNGKTSSENYEEIPLNSIRRTIGQRMASSKLQAPHFRLTIELNIDRIIDLRTHLNKQLVEGKVSLNDILIKATAAALMEVPQVNCRFDGQTEHRYTDAHVAVAVALDSGLITPVVKAANRKSILDISKEMVGLIQKAKNRQLTLDEIEGGTFTLSNLGMFGIKSFDAIINPPQVAILAIGAGERKRLFSPGGETISTVLSATLSCDHRVLDGAIGAHFLKAFKEKVEYPFDL